MTPSPPAAGPSDSEIEHGLRASRRLETPPEHVLLRAMAVWRPRQQPATAASTATGLVRQAAALAESVGAAVRRLTGTLAHDSGWAAPQAFGLRSGSRGIRQLLFTAEGHDIDLRISAAPGTEPPAWQIQGQVLGPASGGSAVLRCGPWSAEARWNELCEFSFGTVPSGRCILLLASGDWEIEVGPIELPPASGDPAGG